MEGNTIARASRLVVMGVAGAGKTTVGKGLAGCLGLPFVEGDDLHSSESIAKMSSGSALSDFDRSPWLVEVGRTLRAAPSGCVVSCSALARRYRDRIRINCPDAYFVYLSADRSALATRISARSSHFMPVTLLDSQLATLEPLEDDERGLEIDATLPLTVVIASLKERLSRAC